MTNNVSLALNKAEEETLASVQPTKLLLHISWGSLRLWDTNFKTNHLIYQITQNLSSQDMQCPVYPILQDLCGYKQ